MALVPTGRRSFIKAGTALVTAVAVPTRAAAQSAATPPAAVPGGTPGRLTFHAIDTWNGATIGTLRVDISMQDGSGYKPVRFFDTAANGRSDGALFEGATFRPGRYELAMHVAEYYAALGAKLPSPSFLSVVPVRFNVADAAQRYHIAVLFGPWSYAYYRGS